MSAWIEPAIDSGEEARNRLLLILSAATVGAVLEKAALPFLALITLAIFGVLLFLVFMVFAMVLGMNANLFWFTHACGSLIGGIVWMYVAAKVPKRGAFAIMSAIVAVVALLLGQGHPGRFGEHQ